MCRLMVAISGKKHKSFVGSPAASVANLKFIAELEILNAGPSTTFVAKNAPNSAQDDSVFLLNEFQTRGTRTGSSVQTGAALMWWRLR